MNNTQDKTTIEILGLRETVEMLNTLPVLVQFDLMRRVNRQLANRIVKPKMKAAIPFGRGGLKDSVKTRNAKKRKTGVIIGPHYTQPVNRFGKEVRGYPARLRFLDKGTKSRSTKKGYDRGSIQGAGLIARAIDGAIPEVVLKLQKDYANLMERHLKNKTRAINRKIEKQLKAKK